MKKEKKKKHKMSCLRRKGKDINRKDTALYSEQTNKWMKRNKQTNKQNISCSFRGKGEGISIGNILHCIQSKQTNKKAYLF